MMNLMKLFSKNRNGLTLIELLVVVAMIALLMIIAFSQFNPLRGRDKAIDSRRKSDLDRLKISMEDYYGDKGCYPTPYPSPAPALPCGGDTDSEFHLYLGTIPCDANTGQAYSYNPEDVDCPSYYRIYTKLSWQDDPQIAAVGCRLGCGPDSVYDYGVSSPNVGLLGFIGCTGGGCWFCQRDVDGTCDCNIAGAGNDCKEDCSGGDCVPPNYCFENSTCGGYVNQPMPY